MDSERAESYLRMLAGAELRRDTSEVAGGIPGRWHSARLTLVAQALSAVGAVDAHVADEIQAGFDVGVAAGQPGSVAETGPGQRGLSPEGRRRLARLMPSPPPWPATGTPRSRGPGPGQVLAASQPAPSRVVPVGKVIGTRDGDVRRELLVVAFVQSSSRALFTMAGWPIHPFTAVDDRGASYRIGYRGGTGEGVLLLGPDPRHEIHWLDIFTTHGEPATRVHLDSQAPPFPVPDITVTSRAASPGELLLNAIAARILTSVAGYRQDSAGRWGTAAHPELHAFTRGLGDIVAALHAAGALSPASPVPSRLAGLCAQLGIAAHGITAPPAADLPGPWQSVLTQHFGRGSPAAPEPGSLAAVVAGLPELDGARMTLLGLHHGVRGTILHMLVGGVTLEPDDWAYGRGLRPLPAFWVRDSSDRWHVTRLGGSYRPRNTREAVLWLQILPPLGRGTAWIEVAAAGQSAEIGARLPLGWQRAGQE